MKTFQILKEQGFFQILMQKKSEGQFPKALLFFCDDSLTSSHVLEMTALLLSYKNFEMFDDKSAEYTKIKNGINLDVKTYPKNGEKLLVADSNEIVSESYVKPVSQDVKIFVIKNFDISTEEAQNKLLKILEEPPKNVYFLISASSAEKVLPTIKSRCEKVQILPLEKEEIAKHSSDKLALMLCGGFVGKLERFEKTKNMDELAQVAISVLCELKTSKQILAFSKKIVEVSFDFDLFFEIVLLAIEDMIKIKCESEDLCKLDMFKDELADVEAEYSIQALCEISKLVSTFQEKFAFNANKNLALDNFLLKMLEVKFICK